MIDKIVQMILTEAITRPGKDPVQNVYDVDLEVRTKLYELVDKYKEQKTLEEEDESKRTNP